MTRLRVGRSTFELQSLMRKIDLDQLGRNALAYSNKEFERTMLMDRIENTFLNMIS